MSKGIIPQLDELLNLRFMAKKIYLLDSKIRVNNLQSGTHLSKHKGRGVDFNEVRPYQIGDDTRMIHWSLTARLGKTFTKIYNEEREKSVYLLIDQSKSMHFGTKICFKNVLASNIAALIGWNALDNHEQVGGIIFNENQAQLFKPKRSNQNFLGLLKTLSDNSLHQKHYNSFNESLKKLSQSITHGSKIVLISDFHMFDAESIQYLNLINRKATIINIMVFDSLEKMLPNQGSFTFTQSGKEILKINANSQSCKKYTDNFQQRLTKLKLYSHQNNMHFISIATNDSIINKINYGVINDGV